MQEILITVLLFFGNALIFWEAMSRCILGIHNAAQPEYILNNLATWVMIRLGTTAFKLMFFCVKCMPTFYVGLPLLLAAIIVGLLTFSWKWSLAIIVFAAFSVPIVSYMTYTKYKEQKALESMQLPKAPLASTPLQAKKK